MAPALVLLRALGGPSCSRRHPMTATGRQRPAELDGADQLVTVIGLAVS